MAAASDVDDGIRRLLSWTAAHSGAARVSWSWWHGHRARVAATWGDWSCLGPHHLQACEAAMEEAVDQGVTVYWPQALPPHGVSEWVTVAHRELVEATSVGAPSSTSGAASIPMPGGPSPLGAVCLEWVTGSAPSPAVLAAIEAALMLAAPVLIWQQAAQRPWHQHLVRSLSASWNRLCGQGAPRRQRLVWTSIVLVAGALLWPVQDQIGGRARVEGAQQRVLVAPSDGFLMSARVHPGDRVKAGQVLADLAQQDLQRERDRWTSQLAQHESGYVGAMARADRADAGLALARAQEAEAQLALVEDQLQRTRLSAPFDGIVIQGDLSQSIGAPVKQGDALLTVASLSQFRVVVEIDEGDIAHIRPGQPGTLALSALPWDTLDLKVTRVVPLALARDGRNVFEVHASFERPLPGHVRPGLLGRAHLEVGRSPRIWNVLRPLVERLRLAWWAWGG